MSVCETCRFYRQGKTWNIVAEKFNVDSELPSILVVDSHPDKVEDNSGRIFSSYKKHSKSFRSLLECLEAPYAIASALGCQPIIDGKDIKPKDIEVKSCANEFLHNWIYQNKPKVIICLGPIAMKAVLGDNSPKKMEPILNSVIPMDPNDDESPKVIVTNHPSIYWIKDEMTQMGIHLQVLSQADEICKGNFKAEKVEYTEVTDVAGVLKCAKTLGETIWFDLEYAESKHNPRKASKWHPDARLICFSITDYYLSKKRTHVFHGPILHMPNVLKLLFLNKIIKAHNVYVDYQCFFAFTGLDLFELAKEITPGIKGVLCTFGACYLRDQNAFGNGLKKLAETIGIPDWSVGASVSLEEAKQNISAAHSYINKQKSKTLRAVRNLRATKLDILRYIKAEDQLQIITPKKAYDYGHIELAETVPYNAGDTDYLECVDREIVTPMFERGEVPIVAYELCMEAIRTLCYIERNGMMVNPKRFKTLKKIVNDKYKFCQDNLIANEKVLRALFNSCPKLVEQLKKLPDYKAKELLRKELSPKKLSLMKELAKVTEMEDIAKTVSDRSKIKKAKNGVTQSVSYDINVMTALAGGVYYQPNGKKIDDTTKDEYWVPFEEKSENQLIWFNILMMRKFFDLRSKFLKELETFTYKGVVRTNYKLFKSEAFGSGMGKDQGGGAGTGRLSSFNPNFQNIAKVFALRWIFDPGEDYYYAECDFKSIEPIILSVITGCEKFQEAFKKGLDIYQVIANYIYNYNVDLNGPIEEVKAELAKKVSKQKRNLTKTSTLAIMYGESPRAFAFRTRLNLEEDVLPFYKKFDELFPEIKDLKDLVNADLDAGNPIVTLTGRRKYYVLPMKSDPKYKQKLQSIRRQAFNFLIQSLANDLMLFAANRVFRWIHSKGEDFKKILQMVNIVHDALYFRVHKDHLYLIDEIKKIMEDRSELPFNLPLETPVEEKLGKDLAEASVPEE